MSDDNVQAVLVNIFAGINRCDWVAEGVVQALTENPVDVPVVVRLSGTNVEEGNKILAASGLPIIKAESLNEAAQKSVHSWKENLKRLQNNEQEVPHVASSADNRNDTIAEELL